MQKYFNEILELLGNERKKLPWLCILFFLSSLLDLLGIGLVGPFVALILDPNSLGAVEVGKIFLLFGWVIQGNVLLWVLGSGLIGAFFIKMILGIIITKKILVFSRNQEVRLRMRLITAYQNLPYEMYLKRNSSEYVYSIVNLTSQFSAGVLTPLLKITSDGIVGAAILLLLAWRSPVALVALISLLGGLIYLYDKIIRGKGKLAGKRANDAAVRLVQVVNEITAGLKELRILGHEKYFQNEVRVSSQKYAFYYLRMSIMGALPRYFLEFGLVLFVVILVISTLGIQENIDGLLVTLSMFGVAALRLIPSATALSKSLVDLRINRDGVQRLYGELNWLSGEKLTKHLAEKLTSPGKKFNRLSARGVSFCYSGTDTRILDAISFEVNAGEAIGVCGTSGSGKTTLVDVLLGLLEPQEGEILYNGLPLRKSLLEWREHVAYLPQNNFLVDDSLSRNVALGIPEDEIDLDKVYLSLKQAKLMDLVTNLPNGLDSRVGERGISLSGGQRQRVSLARAFYHDRDVLIMDEGTSALDDVTEREIVEEINLLKGQRTVIVIAHRISTLKYCDRIYRIENGKNVAQDDYGTVIGPSD